MTRSRDRRPGSTLLMATAGVALLCAPALGIARDRDDFPTTTPIKHLVVIYQENVSFDHYFGTYPRAENPAGEPPFQAAEDTPSVNGLTDALRNANPNLAQPFRLDRSQAVTCDQDHFYTAEQQAVDHGLMDKFIEATGKTGAGCNPDGSTTMGYYDGNTVTALWNYAQRFAMSDNFFGSTYGPSAVGALNLIAGQTGGAQVTVPFAFGALPAFGPFVIGGATRPDGTVIGDTQPTFDDCSTRDRAFLTGKNVGDLLNARGVTWGWFNGGFAPTIPAVLDANGNPVIDPKTGKPQLAVCGAAHAGHPGQVFPSDPTLAGPFADYVPHHSPFQFYRSTSNPHHLPPSSVAAIGKTDQANHIYDLGNFWDAVNAGRMPAVAFLKAPAFQDAHPANSDPLSEQTFLVQTLNRLQRTPEWAETAVIIAYDDSDGWYDHVMAPFLNASAGSTVVPGFPPGSPAVTVNIDALSGPGACGVPKPDAVMGRCGRGPRLPFLLISPWAKRNYVDHTLIDQASILRFIEDNWNLGRIDPAEMPDEQASFDRHAGSILALFDFDDRPNVDGLILDPATGEVIGHADNR